MRLREKGGEIEIKRGEIEGACVSEGEGKDIESVCE